MMGMVVYTVQCVPVNDNGDNAADDDDDDDDDGDDDGDDDDDNQPVCGVERVAGEERGEKRGNAHHHKRPSSLFILQTIQTLFLVIP